MADYRKQLQNLLYELFQFDSADLDFGFYAVMNQKRKQIKSFIETDLLDAIDEGLKDVAEQNRLEAQTAFMSAKKKIQQLLGESALNGDELIERHVDLPLGKEYLAAKASLENAVVAEDLEAQIYNDLYAFFARYYQDGDFISQRRYGRTDKYAIPYNGQEVHLHWANFDQYYVKTGVHFENYSFTVPDGAGLEQGASIRVRLSKVDIPRDNTKGDKRFFIYASEQAVTWDEESQTLIIPMEYRPLMEEERKRVGTRNQQAKLLDEAHTAILSAVTNSTLRARLSEVDTQRQTDKNRLAYHLNRYAAENTRDFFVHKDLKGFLSRELDYYLKAEVLRLEDINFDDPIHTRRAAARIKTMRSIGDKVITFLEQLESFQRKLFLKRKFVLQSDYCLTLDKIPAERRAEFYPDILTNKKQIEEWKRLYGITITAKTNLNDLPHLVLDTAFFNPAFNARLLATFEELDAAIDGLLVHGENFQALNLLATRFREKVKGIYIDPPYNTDASPILYKNNYKDSSWLTLIQNRFELQGFLAKNQAPMSIAIDDTELANLSKLIYQEFPDYEQHKVIVNHYPGSGTGRSNVTRTHEYALFVVPPGMDVLRGRSLVSGTRKRGFRRSGTGENNYRYGRSNSFFAVLVNPKTLEIEGIEPPPPENETAYETAPTEGGLLRIYPMGEDGSERVWSLSYEGALDALENGLLECTSNLVIQRIYIDEERRGLLKSVWIDKQFNATTNGTNLLTDIFGKSGLFSYPKSLYTVVTAIESMVHKDRRAIILDYFGGSGTTAHAIMHLNRTTGSRRKYILVEMDDYFNTVLKPRIQKVAFADEWKNGEPVLPTENDQDLTTSTGQAHMFQYIRLESYDDTFHNILFQEVDGPQLKLLSDMPDYFLSYMLDHETEGSPTLLDLKQFDRPLDYKLSVSNQDGVLAPQPVDLVATFNFLLGLAVHTIRHYERNRNSYIRVVGTDPDGLRICVVWRNVPAAEEFDAERKWLEQKVLQDSTYDKLYINGENTVPNALLTEEEFKRRMFEGVL